MGDAEIIPIGARAKPGRGSGTTPSAAARALAPRSSRRRPVPVPDETPAVPAAPVEPPPPEDDAAGAAPQGGDLTVDSDRDTDRDTDCDTDCDTDWERRAAELLAFLRRRVTGDYEVDEFGFDAEVAQRFLVPMLRPLAEKWFRIEVRGIENVPSEGGALVVSNHSGTIPIDGLMTSLVLNDHAGRSLRSLGADLMFAMPFVGELARKGGATLAGTDDAERLLRAGELVGVWPEGFKGIGKSYADRYKLQRFGRGGFVSAALKVKVPIIPCSVVGAEEIYPMLGNVSWLARLLGVPYAPITPLFPWFGPLGLVPLPSKWIIEFGQPIRTDAYPDGAADDPMLVFNVTDQVRETIQQTLYELLKRRRGVFH